MIRLTALSFERDDVSPDSLRSIIATTGQALKRQASDPSFLYIEGMQPQPKALSAAATPKAETK
jgi:hypothetical protein